MRRHLYRCQQERTVPLFLYGVPDLSKSTIIKCKENVYIYYHCKMQDNINVPMIQCRNGTERFHTKCEKVAKDMIDDYEVEWFYSICA